MRLVTYGSAEKYEVKLYKNNFTDNSTVRGKYTYRLTRAIARLNQHR